LPFQGKKIVELSLAFATGNPADADPPSSSHSHGGGEHDDEHQHDGHDHEENESNLSISQESIDAENIAITAVRPGTIERRLVLPASVVADRNRVAKVAARVTGTVAELKKRLGDPVAKDEVVAILDSREVADAKSEYISALVNGTLQETLFQRAKTLYQKQISSEQTFLRAQATNTEAQVRVGVAHQKLAALGVHENDIASLSTTRQSARDLQRYGLTAPIAGRIVEQFVDLGTPVGGDGQAMEIYSIADLTSVWIEIPLATDHLKDIKEGQTVTIADSHSSHHASGKIIFTSPIVNENTRTARVIAAVDNKNLALRPGSFVNAEILLGKKQVDLKIPKSALQSMKGDTVVFVRTEDGFTPQKVVVGDDDGTTVEIVSGLKPGDEIASTNTFLLKAEDGKSEATHSH
jgi:cobalt-zinc-cadmium efflux system membrane fusion protein